MRDCTVKNNYQVWYIMSESNACITVVILYCKNVCDAFTFVPHRITTWIFMCL